MAGASPPNAAVIVIGRTPLGRSDVAVVHVAPASLVAKTRSPLVRLTVTNACAPSAGSTAIDDTGPIESPVERSVHAVSASLRTHTAPSTVPAYWVCGGAAHSANDWIHPDPPARSPLTVVHDTPASLLLQMRCVPR